MAQLEAAAATVPRQAAGQRFFVNGSPGCPDNFALPKQPLLFVNGRPVAAASPEPPKAEASNPGTAGPGSPRGPWLEDTLGLTGSGQKRDLILFDGMCRLCMNFVKIVASHDQIGKFRFAPLQSNLGQKVLAWHGLPKDLDSVVLHSDSEAFIRSTAALRILRELDGPLSSLYGFIYLPQTIRDWGYELVAKSRYSVLGHTTISKSANEAVLARMVDTWEPDPNDPTHTCKS